MNLSGQIALITGGGRGLGRAFAHALAGAGMHVVITARSEEQLQEAVQRIQEQGGAATAIPSDVTDAVAVQRLVATVEEQLGGIALLVNNAGTFRAFGRIADIDPQEWWREVEINLRGPFLCTRAVLPPMLERGRGRIVNVASGAGLQPFETISAYNVSKTALIRLTESTALEVQSQGIGVFAIDPGTVRTPMNAYVHDSPEVARRTQLVQQWFHELYAANGDTPMEKPVDVVLQIAAGQADALTGCFFGVKDDIGALAQQAEVIQRENRRKLRMQM
jgi:NAD(P)-dependent dehydrogenase (short-subunit alcohol dehydrogenase family)